jgi:hypothetical protein
MNRRNSAPVADKRLAQAILERDVEMAMNPFHQTEHSTENSTSERHSAYSEDLFHQVNQLDVIDRVTLIQSLIAQLEPEHIQSILETGQKELAARQQRMTTSKNRQTRLLLKKDYSYQDRGLSEPTQYYVYIRRRKPKLDRYIGTLFYIPQGCTLSYDPDAEGRILFNSPRNVFQLRDCKNPAVVQVVRLICLEPPPPEYTFTKQQNDMPEIYLRLEYLDPRTYQPIAEESYPFPFCMYEGGMLDRYRWDVTTIMLPAASTDSSQPVSSQTAAHGVERESTQLHPESDLSDAMSPQEVDVPPHDSGKHGSGKHDSGKHDSGKHDSGKAGSRPPRRIIELPSTASITCFLADREDSSRVLERLRLWVTWSEKAMPQAKWKIVQVENDFILINVNFNRKILSFSLAQSAILLESSLPVLMKWFHDLSLAVSQAQNQRQYSSKQLKLAHNIFVKMSLPQDDPLVVLKTLFDVEFSKTTLYR